MLCETQSVSSRIWTRLAVFISKDDNHYTITRRSTQRLENRINQHVPPPPVLPAQPVHAIRTIPFFLLDTSWLIPLVPMPIALTCLSSLTLPAANFGEWLYKLRGPFLQALPACRSKLFGAWETDGVKNFYPCHAWNSTCARPPL